ncbi:glycosyltransferase family 1 protein [Psychrobacter frigidicola]|uniref:Glycosyltransferase family 1 protein n=1 Tax=Psychrobacter frigidicola TaxID=45611 RepID=A0A5C7A6K2_9GAMM|nr:glycosyltransferase [Psychrobacter frigidicola]TXD98114.1 glycosyltransferase family 1 protein [Psychrobacter frigidicola]
MKYKSIFFISPPFYSHFNPLLNLAKSFNKLGVEIYMGCSIEFKDQVKGEGLEFYEIDISTNKNIQKAENTDQPDSEKERLEEFFESTKKGAVETLITQSRHRKADMLYDPHKLIDDIQRIDETFNVDLYVVDILSYSVTLALYSLDLDFITFCPPHPYTIPDEEMNYGMPKYWPSAIKVEESDLDRLRAESKGTQKEFTEVFNKIISENNLVHPIDNAFNLVSDIAVIYNYFDFNNLEELERMPYKIYAGHSFKERNLDNDWKKIVDNNQKKILITLGTFLSNRKDILDKLIKSARKQYPEAIIIVSAGANAKALEEPSSDKTIISDFIPQIALMPWIDLVIFHGGCNTLTEAMYYGKEMIILPFSSDQFNIAYDIEQKELGVILDPNNFDHHDMVSAFKHVEQVSKDKLKHYSEISQSRGSDFAAKIVLGLK